MMVTNLALTFPAGRRRTLAIPATAGNATFNLSPADGKRYKILRGTVTLVNDANAANRFMVFTITDGTNITEWLAVATLSIAGQTAVHSFGEAVVIEGGQLGHDLITGGPVELYFGIQNLIIEGDEQFRITVTSGLAGDSFSGSITVLEL